MVILALVFKLLTWRRISINQASYIWFDAISRIDIWRKKKADDDDNDDDDDSHDVLMMPIWGPQNKKYNNKNNDISQNTFLLAKNHND